MTIEIESGKRLRFFGHSVLSQREEPAKIAPLGSKKTRLSLGELFAKQWRTGRLPASMEKILTSRDLFPNDSRPVVPHSRPEKLRSGTGQLLIDAR